MQNPRRGWVPLLAMVLAVATGCGSSSDAAHTAPAVKPAAQESAPAEDAIAIKVGRISRGTLSSLYSTSATLRAEKRATVTARTQGVIRQLLVEEGDWVREGQSLAVLEDEAQRIAFEQARANAENQRREYERAATLHEQELLSVEAFETTRRESVDAAHMAELAELTLSRTVIRATFSGQVLTRQVDVGATVSDGTPIFEIADLSPLYADVQIPERQVRQLSPGQQVRVSTESDGESLVTDARIERIAPVVDPGTGTIKVTVAVGAADGLRPGSFVRVGIVTDTHVDALIVPRSALVAEGRRWHLFRLKSDDPSRVELVEVERGFEEADRVEILGAASAQLSLSVGDRVVTTGASSLSDDSVVEVVDEAAEADELADAEAELDRPADDGDEKQVVAS